MEIKKHRAIKTTQNNDRNAGDVFDLKVQYRAIVTKNYYIGTKVCVSMELN